MKKILSLLVAVATLGASIISVPVFAATTVNIAQFVYTNGTAGGDLPEDMTNAYGATGGELKSSAKLRGSVDGKNFCNLSWTKAEYTYNSRSSQVVPCIAADDDNEWATGSGYFPYFLVECSTKNYENITFSANLGGSKKGPANYKLQYSTDNQVFTDIGATVSVEDNKDLDSYKFNSVPLSAATFDKDKIYIRIIASDYNSIKNGLLSVAPTGGEAAINSIIVSGTTKEAQTLTASTPISDIANNAEIYSDQLVSFTDDTAGAQIKYQINNGETQDYIEPFAPFGSIADTTVSIKVWAVADGYQNSSTSTYTYTCTKDKIAGFNFANADDMKYANGKIKATSGLYPTAKISASLDGATRFVPVFDFEENSVAIAPDDTYKWKQGGFWQFEISTAGYDTTYLSLDAFSSKKGPASMSLKYSFDNINYYTIQSNKVLPVSSPDVLYSNYELPSVLANKEKVYIRLVMEEDKRANVSDLDALFDNESKGNTYINNIEFSGDRSSSLKMPYTTKKTEYFGSNGTIEFISPDNADIKYSVYTENGTAVAENQLYTAENPIIPALLNGFNATLRNKFRIDAWCEKGSEKSAVNSKYYTYKGETIAEIIGDELTEIGTEITSENATLSMYPNGKDAAEISYNAKDEALRVSAEDTNSWNFDTTRSSTSNDGYWLIKTSTKGYKNITLSLDQLSTSKGPRDWCINYSLDNASYYALENSNIRVTEDLSGSYTNIELPEILNDKETVYIKIKIDGGENVGAAELSAVDDVSTPDVDETMVGKGNTAINDIEICGIKIENKVDIEAFIETLEKGKTYYINSASETNSTTIIIAGYNGNNELVFFKSNEESFTVPQDSETVSVKVMMWENLGSLKPLSPYTYKIVE